MFQSCSSWRSYQICQVIRHWHPFDRWCIGLKRWFSRSLVVPISTSDRNLRSLLASNLPRWHPISPPLLSWYASQDILCSVTIATLIGFVRAAPPQPSLLITPQPLFKKCTGLILCGSTTQSFYYIVLGEVYLRKIIPFYTTSPDCALNVTGKLKPRCIFNFVSGTYCLKASRI